MVKGLIWLLSFQFLGVLIAQVMGWIVPGPVVGMALLFALLLIINTPASLIQVSDPIIKNIALLFLPPSAGLFFLPQSIYAQWLALAAAMVVGTAISITLCALLLKWMCKQS